MIIEQYRVSHNLERQHSSLGWRTPAEFAVGLDADGRAPHGFADSVPWKAEAKINNETDHALS